MLLRITGYSDKYSVHPGEEVKFFVNSEKNETYEAQLDVLFMVIPIQKAQVIKRKR